MCGLAGFAGIKDQNKKEILTIALGLGIDVRGGDAAGYVAIKNNKLIINKRKGEFLTASQKFFDGAMDSQMCMLHSRFATCSTDEVKNAHPFAIKRNGRVKLHGMHNGIVPSSWDSAKKNNREVNVDSEEIFQLIADEDYQGIRDMSGYGVALWVNTNQKDRINLVRLSEDSEIVMYRLKCGGIVWASTASIAKDAIKTAGLKIKTEFDLTAIGTVYNIHEDELYISDITGLEFKEYKPMRMIGHFSPFNFGSYGKHSVEDSKLIDDIKDAEFNFLTEKYEAELKIYEDNAQAKDEIKRLYQEQLMDLFDNTEDDQCVELNNLL